MAYFMLVGIPAHAHGSIRKVAEYATAIFPGNNRLPAAAYGMAQLRALKGVGFRLFHRYAQGGIVRIVSFNDTVTIQSSSMPGW